MSKTISDAERERRSQRMKDMHASKRAEKAEQEVEFAASATEEPQRKRVRDASERKGRNLLNGMTLNLDVAGRDPDYHYRWFNDEPGRIEKAMHGDYELVDRNSVQLTASRRVTDSNAAVDSRVEMVNNRDKDARSHKTVLMRIRKEWFKEDQEEIEQKIDLAMQDVQDSAAEGGRSYIPKSANGQALKITRS